MASDSDQDRGSLPNLVETGRPEGLSHYNCSTDAAAWTGCGSGRLP